jgi:DNA-binding transcriptional regulator YhcF (GntR family)
MQLYYCDMQVSASDTVGKLKDVAKASGRCRLPSIRQLAATWGLSTGAVQAAVRKAVAQGWLETRPGSGIWVHGSLPALQPPPQRLDALRLSERIASEIQAGKIASGQDLPTPKDYSKLLGIHPATVRKALAILLSQGILERRGRSWAVRRPAAKAASRSPVLLCIGAPDANGNLRMDTDPEWDFWREIQAEALRCGLEPRLITWKDALLEPGADVFGAVVSNWHMPDSTALLDTLLRLRLPASVWVANSESLPGGRYRYARTMWFHDLSFGRGSGAMMAAYVARLHHRRIAWISPFHASSWAQNRLIGLQEALPKGFSMHEANGEWVSEWDIQKDVALDPQVLGRISLAGIDHGGMLDAIARPLVEVVTRERCLEIFAPRLDAAWQSGATLWVAASDLAAQWCLHWLDSRGLQVPEDVSLVSFDDTREASRIGLTSLRFDVQAMARAMVRQILSSRQSHQLVTRYTGHVFERASSSR